MNNSDNKSNTFPGLTLSVIRIVLGVFWLLQLTWKPPPGFGCPSEGFCFWLDQEIQYPVIQLYANFVSTVIRPNVILFGWITTVVEVSIGILLVLGLFTRLGALVGTLWSINLLIGLANVPHEQGWYYAFLIMLNLVFVSLGATGQVSVDRSKGWRTWWGRAHPTLT